jgi:hypothetical protein
MKNFGFLIAIFVVFNACESKQQKRILKEANGRINHMLVVMKNSEWQGEIGDELRKIIAEPVLGLPQPEAQFEISQVPPESFGSMFRATRSVLNIGIGEENNFKVAADVYASPQRIITITGVDNEALIQQIQEHQYEIVRVFKDADLTSVRKRLLASHHDPAKIKTFTEQGYSLKIPKTYRYVEDDGSFLWYRYHLDGGNSMELIAYTIPINSEDDTNGNNIVTHRDAIGKKYIPGEIEGSHMITEAAYTPHIFEIELDGKKAFETRGKWEVKNMYMAGPFLSYSVVDEANNRLVVVEGLTYAPSINKRDYMFELEAIMKTLTIN